MVLSRLVRQKKKKRERLTWLKRNYKEGKRTQPAILMRNFSSDPLENGAEVADNWEVTEITFLKKKVPKPSELNKIVLGFT